MHGGERRKGVAWEMTQCLHRAHHEGVARQAWAFLFGGGAPCRRVDAKLTCCVCTAPPEKTPSDLPWPIPPVRATDAYRTVGCTVWWRWQSGGACAESTTQRRRGNEGGAGRAHMDYSPHPILVLAASSSPPPDVLYSKPCVSPSSRSPLPASLRAMPALPVSRAPRPDRTSRVRWTLPRAMTIFGRWAFTAVSACLGGGGGAQEHAGSPRHPQFTNPSAHQA